jgi:hypothetical protein
MALQSVAASATRRKLLFGLWTACLVISALSLYVSRHSISHIPHSLGLGDTLERDPSREKSITGSAIESKPIEGKQTEGKAS